MRTARTRLAALAAGAGLLPLGLLFAVPASAAPGPTATFGTDSTWGSGYQGRYTITAGDTALSGWRVEFDLPAGTTVGSYWDATETVSGNHYTFTNREYNGAVAAGASTGFGFLASGSGQPTNCELNGQPCGQSTPPPTTTTTTTTSPVTPPQSGGGQRVAPYVDITYASPTLADVARATGQKDFTLAFALASSTGCEPQWGGTVPLADPRVIGEVNDLKALGGSVIVSTGGAMGPYLENTCGSVDALYNAYTKVLDAVGANSLDVDVEASIPVATVNQALLRLRQSRGTAVSYTLRVQGQDYGVDPFSVQILQDAAARGLNVVVNPMLMDFGYTGSWSDAMISAANATLNQMKNIWPSRGDAAQRAMLAITPMIGRNDSGMVTDEPTARQLLSWAQSNHIARIGFWSVGRDNGGCPGAVQPTCSGISQGTYDFTNIFKTYQG
ncbi:cellulose binding domain-containing protein [Gandjariella thermophila]|uniref:Chitinase n=1 Tax=Gandjariella thermophila TaxID=1931992 RepID=A0A4D4JDC7_9PSEU|nr:cellulose binding domain-containing protein [Gandjariella thermophila]GDY31873.1 chitinase [Gandjariella thermophila]